MLGPFTAAGNPTNDSKSFDAHAQSTYIIPNLAYTHGGNQSLAEFIYIADRWQTNTTDFGRYLWLPLVVEHSADDGHNPSIPITNPVSWRYDLPMVEE